MLCHICAGWRKFIGQLQHDHGRALMGSIKSIVALFFCLRIVVVGEIQGYRVFVRDGEIPLDQVWPKTLCMRNQFAR